MQMCATTISPQHTACVFVLSFWGQGVHVCACCRGQRLILCLYLFLKIRVYCEGAHGGQKRVSGLMELGLQAFVRYPTWVLGTEFPPSTRPGSALITSAISLASFTLLFEAGSLTESEDYQFS